MKNTLEAAEIYLLQRAWSPIPIQTREKGPRLKGWQTLRLFAGDIPRLFAPHGNIGVILGRASGDDSRGLMDADLDCPQAVEIAPEFLPLTQSIFGRKSKRRSHWLYNVEPAAFETIRFRDPLDGATLLELRGEGGFQTMVPPSIHPCGERVEWEIDQPPARVNATDLLRAGSRLTAACLVCKYNRGGRAVIQQADQVWLEALAGHPKELRDAVRSLLGHPDQPPTYQVNPGNEDIARALDKWSADSAIQLWHEEAEPARALLRSLGICKPWPKTIRVVIEQPPETKEWVPALAVALHDAETRLVAGVEIIGFRDQQILYRRVLKPRNAELRAELWFAFPLWQLLIAESFEVALIAGRRFRLPAWACCGPFPASITLPGSVKEVMLIAEADPGSQQRAAVLAEAIRRSGRRTAIKTIKQTPRDEQLSA